MAPSPQPRPERYAAARQESCCSDLSAPAFLDENARDTANKLRAESDELKAEDSSSSSNRLSGSGAGYSADCSSSESSSMSSKQRTTAIHHGFNGLSLGRDLATKTSPAHGRLSLGVPSFDRKSKHHHSHVKGKEAGSDWEQDQAKQASTARLDHADTNAASFLNDFPVLPQWNGVRITHPMDPRIDLSTVGYTLTTNVASGTAGGETKQEGNHQPTLDHYLHLMEAVRPFFGAYGAVQQGNAEVKGTGASDATNAASSEGFTSFFTTTQSNTGTNSSDSNSDPRRPGSSPTGQEPGRPTDRAYAAHNESEVASDSSMIALARVKRKHQKRRHEENADDSPSSEEKRRRHGEQDGQGSSENYEEPVQQGPQPEHDGPARNEAAAQEARLRQDNSSSSSDEPPRVHLPANMVQFVSQGIPIVSESSFARSSNSGGFSSTSNVGASNTSGSGSGGNSGISNHGSAGSGSNNGSSGSGNEGKGENSGGDGNSDENLLSPNAKNANKDEASGHPLHQPADTRQANSSGPASQLDDPANAGDDATREKKLMDKKRKRMNMRREYEEQKKHDMESSESSDSPDDTFFEPGQPVTLDNALSFSKAARLILQATPPFLVVHANAAYTGLTGVDSHEVNGRTISSLFTLKHATRHHQGRTMAHAQQGAAVAGQAHTDDNSIGMNVERLVISNGFGQHHVINVKAKQSETTKLDDSVTIPCRMSVSPVVAHSPPESMEVAAVVTDTNHDASKHHSSKRRKHHHDHKPMDARQQRTVITHYVIQLKKVDVPQPLTAGLETNPLNSSKMESSGREMMDLSEEALLDETSQSTDAKEPVSSIG